MNILANLYTSTKLSESRLSFEFLRLVFAIMVVISHLGSTSMLFTDWKFQMNNYLYTIGNFAVFGFFLVSGYVIFASYINNPSPRNFVIKRVMRIYPAYWVSLIIGSLILTPILLNPGLGIGQYFGYFVRNFWAILVTCNPTNAGIPGDANCVNTPTWSLMYEIGAYLFVLVIGMLGLIKNKLFVIGCFVLSTAGYYLRVTNSEFDQLIQRIGGVWLAESFAFGAWFLAGGLFWIYREKIRLNFGLFVIASLIGIGSTSLGILRIIDPVYFLNNASSFGLLDSFPIVGPLCTSYVVLFLANRLPLHWWNKELGDISFGVYLYGWLGERVLSHYNIQFIDRGFYSYFAVVIAIIMGMLSYHLIERPIGLWTKKITSKP